MIPLTRSNYQAGDSQASRKCEAFLENVLGAAKVLLTPSCTAALELSALLLDIGPGDEVILPSFTFPSTANAFVLRGAVPVWCDIRPDTLNMDENLVPGLITRETRAIVPVHYAGVGCAMLVTHNVAIVEDNAHGLFGKINGQWLGTIGNLGCLSFHATKNYSCGEGGALIINDPALIERAQVIREKGTNRQSFLAGKVDKYQWIDIGSSYLMADILAKVLYLQLTEWQEIQDKRIILHNNYYSQLSSWAARNGVRLPFIPAGCKSAYHLFYLIMPDVHTRQRLQNYLADYGMQSASHYQPLHSSPMGRRWSAKCPVTEDIAGRLLRLPFYNDLTLGDQDKIIETITRFE